MKNYTNKYSQERMYIMSENELREYRKETIRKYKAMKKRKFKRALQEIKRMLIKFAIGAFKMSLVLFVELVVIAIFICSIPPR